MSNGASTGVLRGSPQPLGIADMVLYLMQHRRVLVGVPTLFVAVVALLTIAREPTYTAGASFYPQQRPGNGSLFAGVAAQFGLSGVGGGDVFSSEFYVRLMRSRTLLGQLANDTFTYADAQGTRTAPLLDLMEIRGATPEIRTERAAKDLRDNLSLSIVRETGVVEVAVTAAAPGLAVDVLRRLLNYVNDYDVAVRQHAARAQREFVESRLEEAVFGLREAEDRMAQFLAANRGFSNSPDLQFQYDRLMRGVQSRQHVYQSLLGSFEDARLEEVRNTPVISIVEQPTPPARRDSRGTLVNCFLALIIGLVCAIGIVEVRALFAGVRDGRQPEAEALRSAIASARGDFNRPWKIFTSR
jgi:uncharacterized protein involved in exopolysaccharide biosynthesis